MRSAADMLDVGCPDPAWVLQRMASTRSWRPSSRTASKSAEFTSVLTWHSYPTARPGARPCRPSPSISRGSGAGAGHGERLGSHERGEGGRVEGLGEEVTLADVALELAQHRQLAGVLDALGYDLE